MGLCPTRYSPIAGDVAAYWALDLVRMAEIAVHFISKSRHVSMIGQSRTTSAQSLGTHFVLTDMSLTETCQSGRAAANEKKDFLFHRLIGQNAFNFLFFRSRDRGT